ncbi:MAG: DUF1934 domain-containing protein [Clostridia bacterium]|jgi:uncharacterized beta-barrel protein YwiB (DUF1934 family)|nr:DUF1934 domain-containing protein [Clostridia bacterium]MBO7215988.1 DUF1934 domain-containing protein [Clostridia bacterium]MBO7246516.1 DUF1934 domain-containing protein [Clostridia bacterium]MBO7737430.1 DUF1934 domain-containing protein [Clostridia bacterium]MBQ5843201.1 DUF1934 domain-containing protein [Clostridia bacterium]
MKIPVTVNIKTERKTHDPLHLDNPRTEIRTATVNGYLSRTKKGFTCVFSEEETDTVTTVSSLGKNLISVNKIGDFNSLMVFDPEKSYSCVYHNGNMPMQIKVNTKSLRNGLTEQGGKIDIDYTVEIVGNLAEHTKMSFSVLPQSGLVS